MGGVIVWVVSDETVNGSETGTSFRQALYFKEAGLNIHDTMIWKKESATYPSTTRYYQNFEYMFVFSKGGPKTINLITDRKNIWSGTQLHGTDREKDGSLHAARTGIVKDYGVRFNVWEITSEKNNKTDHPAVFPVRLAADHITTWTNPGDIVLDPFMGSGTTGVAARMLNRNFVGCELNPEYHKVAERRIFNEGENLFSQ